MSDTASAAIGAHFEVAEFVEPSLVVVGDLDPTPTGQCAPEDGSHG